MPLFLLIYVDFFCYAGVITIGVEISGTATTIYADKALGGRTAVNSERKYCQRGERLGCVHQRNPPDF